MICHADVWAGVIDRSAIIGWRGIPRLARWLLSYPRLIIRYLALPDHQSVIVGYPGHLDVLVIWPFAKIRKAKIVWNTYISMYDTVVGDRELVPSWSPIAYLISAWEWLCSRAADLTLLDTKANAKYFASRYGVDPERIAAVLIGVEPEMFPRARSVRRKEHDPDRFIQVLFFGQMIPLHGLNTILQAVQLGQNDNIFWTLVGRGQDDAKVRTVLEDKSVSNLSWVGWVPQPELIDHIHNSDICLGIFGVSSKANRVIANKVYEVIAAGKPLITRDSTAIRELLSSEMLGIRLIEPGNPHALLDAVRDFGSQREHLSSMELHLGLIDRISPEAIGADLLAAMEKSDVI